MCPKFKGSICEIAGLKPEHADKKCCHSSKWEWCKLYIADLLILSRPKFNNQFHRRKIA